MANDIVDGLKKSLADTLSGKSVKDAVISGAKSVLGIKDDPPPAPPKPPDDPWHDEQVRKANESFKPKPASKPVPKYKDGIDNVPETGPAILHKGEAVLNKEDAAKYRRHMSSPEKSLGKRGRGRPKGSKAKAKKHKIRHTHIEHGDDGSHVIRHSFDQSDAGEGESIPDSVHGVGDADGLLSHMQGQFGGQVPPAGADAGAGAAGPAAGAGAPPQAGM